VPMEITEIGQEGADEIRLTQDSVLQIGLRMCSVHYLDA
jgi:hypothetical protein